MIIENNGRRDCNETELLRPCRAFVAVEILSLEGQYGSKQLTHGGQRIFRALFFGIIGRKGECP